MNDSPILDAVPVYDAIPVRRAPARRRPGRRNPVLSFLSSFFGWCWVLLRFRGFLVS